MSDSQVPESSGKAPAPVPNDPEETQAPGAPVPTEVFLEADPKIPGQNYVCLSFLSPERVFPRKERFFAKHFLADFLSNKQNVENLMEDLNKQHDRVAQMLEDNVDAGDIETYKKMQRDLSYSKVNDLYEGFLVNNEQPLEEAFYAENQFQTTTRGLKVRGVYDTYPEAVARAELIRERDPNFHIFVGKIGFWLPWDPNPDNVQDVEYQNKDLNAIAKKYRENKEDRDTFFEENKRLRVEEARRLAEEKKRLLQMGEGTDDVETSKSKVEQLRSLIREKEKELGIEETPEEGTSTSTQQFAPQNEDAAQVFGNEPDPWLNRKREED